MTDDEHNPGKDAHDYLFEPTSETKPHRARRIDEILDKHEAQKIQRKFVMYLFAIMAAVATGLTNYQEVVEWLRKASND